MCLRVLLGYGPKQKSQKSLLFTLKFYFSTSVPYAHRLSILTEIWNIKTNIHCKTLTSHLRGQTMPAAIRYPPGGMVSHLNNTFSDSACFSSEIIKAHHLLSIPLAPEVHFLGSSCRSSYSCCQLFKVEINSPWKAISTAQGSFCCFGLHWVCSKWSNTREGEQSFRYFFCSWRQLFANALLRCEFQNNKNTSEDYKHKPKYLRTQKKHKRRQRCQHPKALKGIKSSGH